MDPGVIITEGSGGITTGFPSLVSTAGEVGMYRGVSACVTETRAAAPLGGREDFVYFTTAEEPLTIQAGEGGTACSGHSLGSRSHREKDREAAHRQYNTHGLQLRDSIQSRPSVPSLCILTRYRSWI